MKRAAIIIAAYIALLLWAVLPVQQTSAPGPLPTPVMIAPAPPEEVRGLVGRALNAHFTGFD